MCSIPVALIGALLRAGVDGQTFNLLSAIALVMLLGLVAKNGILLIDYANTLRKRGPDLRRGDSDGRRDPFAPDRDDDRRDGLRHAAARFGVSLRAQETRRSMGVVLIGGLLSSLFLTPVPGAGNVCHRQSDRGME